jgi:conjugative transfer signal peptidase TraF
MPDARDLPLFRWGEELRRLRLSRRSSHLRTLAAIGATIVIALVMASVIWPPRPLLVWNASASAPVGLYAVTEPVRIRRGARVIARAPDRARRLAGERGYLPTNVPLVKRVAAIAGDRVCAVGEALFINGEFRARRRRRDGKGRGLAWWNGCVRLKRGQVFLLSASATSFDGRYFGVTEGAHVVGEARLLMNAGP